MDDQYFEGTLQLRNCGKEIEKYIEKEIDKNQKVWIAKKIKVKGGIDYYISSWRYILAIGKKLKQKFKGELKTSRKLFTQNRQTMKKVYRVTAMFRMHRLKIGQAVNYRGKKVKIKTLGKKVSGKEIDTGKRVSFGYDEIADTH